MMMVHAEISYRSRCGTGRRFVLPALTASAHGGIGIGIVAEVDQLPSSAPAARGAGAGVRRPPSDARRALPAEMAA